MQNYVIMYYDKQNKICKVTIKARNRTEAEKLGGSYGLVISVTQV